MDAWESSVKEREGFSKLAQKQMLLSPETLLGLQITGMFFQPFSIVLVFLVAYNFPTLQHPALFIFLYTSLVKSFVELVKFIFTIPGVTTFLSERLSQDPLEKFFGCQRQRGGVNENPNVHDFCKNTQALRVIHSTCISSVRSNCRGNKEPIDLDQENRPLPKRRRKH